MYTTLGILYILTGSIFPGWYVISVLNIARSIFRNRKSTVYQAQWRHAMPNPAYTNASDARILVATPQRHGLGPSAL